MPKKKVSLIIVHYNTVSCLEKQLGLLFSSFAKEELEFEVIVVDNASLNHKQKNRLSDKFEKVKFIFNQKNIGFGGGVNLGVSKSNFENLLILNPDIFLNYKDLQIFINEFDRSSFDAASPCPKSVNYQKPLPTFFSILVEFTIFKKILPLETFKSITLTGGCLLIKKSVFTKISGFDNDFFLWFEDSDLTNVSQNK